MEYSSRIKIESKACPGVVFTIQRMTWMRRLALRDRQAAARGRMSGEGGPVGNDRL